MGCLFVVLTANAQETDDNLAAASESEVVEILTISISDSSTEAPEAASTPISNTSTDEPEAASKQVLDAPTEAPETTSIPVSDVSTEAPDTASTPVLDSSTEAPETASTPVMDASTEAPDTATTSISDASTRDPDAVSAPVLDATTQVPDLSSIPTIELTVDTFVEFPSRTTLEEIESLVELGMTQLAHSILIQSRPDYESSDQRAEWESLFFAVAKTEEDWTGIVERAEALSDSSNIELYAHAQTQAVEARLQMGEVELAKATLRQLIWELPYDQDRMVHWRELMVQCYLAEKSLDQARIAMSVYDQDYRPGTPQWEHRYARTLFNTGNLQQAYGRIASLQTTESRLLALYADYRSEVLTPLEVVHTGLAMVSELSNRPLLEVEMWALIESAARNINDLEIQVTAIESALSLQLDSEVLETRHWVIPPNTLEQLLAAYDDLAISVGNDFNLVVGDDPSWYGLAQEFDITAPVVARAIYAFLARQTSDTQVYQAGVYGLADSLNGARLDRLMESLFVDSEQFEITTTPTAVRTKLANRALRRKDFKSALSIMNTLEEPEEADRLLSWRLRRARVAIAVKEYIAAFQLISQMIDALHPESEPSSIDRIMQVVFDLQENGVHEFAVTLFEQLYPKTANVQTRREILRWVSESLAEQDRNVEASEMLIRSARMDGGWDDNWGKSARMQAADELAVAGLYDDARVLYTELRESSLDPRSKALISNRLKLLPDPQ